MMRPASLARVGESARWYCASSASASVFAPLGPLEVVADALLAGVHHVLDGRDTPLPHADEQHEERERAPDDLVRSRGAAGWATPGSRRPSRPLRAARSTPPPRRPAKSCSSRLLRERRAAANAKTSRSVPTTASSTRMRVRTVLLAVRVSAGDDEGEHEPEERERFGERDAEEHGRADDAGRLGLARHRGDGVADHEADADAGADRGAAVDDAAADCGQTRLELAGILSGRVGGSTDTCGPPGWNSVVGVHGTADVHGSEDGEDERLQEARRGPRRR